MENIFQNITDERWFEMLTKSINEEIIDGIKFPVFPNKDIQSQFVGSSNESALKEGYQFYQLVKGYASALGMPLSYDSSKLLDFGCGWGRYLRFFRKDISIDNLFGVDIDPNILEVCRSCGVAGQLSRIFPSGKLPYPDKFFDCSIAYSVFTHLPENIHLHWVSELARVAKPGCVFVLTLESKRFLNFIASIDRDNPPSGWHAGLSHFQDKLGDCFSDFDNGNFVYLPTGGGDFRAADVYGDAVVPRAYIERKWSGFFNVIDYIDDPERFWQAVLIVQRK